MIIIDLICMCLISIALLCIEDSNSIKMPYYLVAVIVIIVTLTDIARLLGYIPYKCAGA